MLVCRSLFVPERDGRIDGRRPPCRDVGGDKSNHRQNAGDGGKGERIVGLHTKQQTREKTRHAPANARDPMAQTEYAATPRQQHALREQLA